MDVPLPLLERIKRHVLPTSLDSCTQKQKEQRLNEDDETKTATQASSAQPATTPELSEAASTSVTTEAVAGSSSSCSTNNSWNSTLNEVDRFLKRRCHTRANKSGKARAPHRGVNVDGGHSNTGSCNDASDSDSDVECLGTSATLGDSFRASSNRCASGSYKSSAGSCDDIPGLSVVEGERTDRNARSPGTQRGRREGTKIRKSIQGGSAALVPESAGSPAQDVAGDEKEDAAAVATEGNTLSARCTWLALLHLYGDNNWKCRGLYANEGFHCVYLLRSLKTSRCTYIGYSVNPVHRLRQHNGDVTHGGAWKTRRHRPWALVLVVYGFPHAVAALQFEWRWQRILPPAPAGSTKKDGFQNRLLATSIAPPSSSGATVWAAERTGPDRIEGNMGVIQAPTTCRSTIARGSPAGLHDTKMRNEAAVLQKKGEQASVTTDYREAGGVGAGVGMKCAPTLHSAASGSVSLLPFYSVKDASGRDEPGRRQSPDKKGSQMESVNAESFDRPSSHGKAAIYHKTGRGIQLKGTVRQNALSAAVRRKTESASVPGCSDSVRPGVPETHQRAPYRLSRTGHGIVARVGLRLQTLMALLHTEPFKRMPLGVHVVDSYTAAPYFRLLLRERKAAELQQSHRHGDMAPRCALSRDNRGGYVTRQRGWIPLRRFLLVSFGESALLLPLIRNHLVGRHTARQKSTSRSTNSASDAHNAAHGGCTSTCATASDDETHGSGSYCSDAFRDARSVSGNATDVLDDGEASPSKRAASATGTAAPSSDGGLCASVAWAALNCSADTNERFTSRLPRCKLCGQAFMRETRERPASRCGRCMCFYHLTCLARSMLGKKPCEPFQNQRRIALESCSFDSRAHRASGSEVQEGGCEKTGGNALREDHSSAQGCGELVPHQVKCVCCGFVKTWAEVLADGVVFSADSVQEE